MTDVESQEASPPLSLPPPPPPLPPMMNVQPPVFKMSRSTFLPALVHFAVNEGNLEKVKNLITREIDLNYRMHGNTPLFLAILKEEFDIAQCLVSGGADTSIPEKFRWLRQPIHLAASAGQLELVQQLVKHGANVHAADATLMTPLHWAAYKGHREVVDYLLDVGAHVNSRDDCGRTPLFRAVECNDTIIVDALAMSGGVINTRDKFNWTPMFHSIVCGHVNMIRHLLNNYTIDIDAQTVDGDTALHYALTRTNSSRLDVLSATGVDMYMREVKAPTPSVHEAVRQEECMGTLAEMFIDYGCKVNMRNREGTTPFVIAVNYFDRWLHMLLLSAGADITLEEHWIKSGYWPDAIVYDPCFKSLLTTLSQKRVLCLKEKCRLVIRRSLRPFIHSKIDGLPLPISLRQYLYANMDNQPHC